MLQSLVVSPAEKQIKEVKNLGYLLSNWKIVTSFEFIHKAQGGSDGYLIANFNDGRFYITSFMCWDVCQHFLSRSIFRGLKVTEKSIKRWKK